MPNGLRAVVWVVTVAVLSGSWFASLASAGERQFIDCRAQKIMSDHEFEEGLDTRYNPLVELFQVSDGAGSTWVLQLGAFQDFDSDRGDKIEFKSTATHDSAIARYREFQWSVQIDVSKTSKAGFRRGTLSYREDPKSQLKVIAELSCR